MELIEVADIMSRNETFRCEAYWKVHKNGKPSSLLMMAFQLNIMQHI
jgi:hypothetical protein